VTVHAAFRKIAHATACAIGSPYAFATAVLVVVVWAVCGPAFHYSDTWQLVINTGTTIVTFLVVFMIQNTQNRDSRAIHLKLDELIRAVASARNRLVDVEDLPDEELAQLAREFQRLRRLADAREAAAAPAHERVPTHGRPRRSSDKA
jgi:low affinity Fe/Cu permease